MNNQRNRILVIGSLGFNGIASVIMNYFMQFDKTKIKMDFFTSDSQIRKHYYDYIIQNGSHVFKINKKFIIRYYIILFITLIRGKYDIVHIHGNSATILPDLLVSRILRKKVITHIHNTTNKYKNIHRMLKKTLTKLANVRLACSIEAGNWGYSSNDFIVINNSVDVKSFSTEPDQKKRLKKEFGLIQFSHIFLHVGTFTEQKNHEFLLDIFNNIYKKDKESLLICIGDGILKNKIIEKSQSMGLSDNILFTGNITNVNQYYSISDAFLLPSIFEGLPVVLIEAQYSGCTVFASDVITNECIISNNIHFLDLKKGASYWANYIIEKMKVELVSILNDNAHKFDIENNVNKLMNIYERIIK